jgi:peptidoglycan/LPS O-acetylase OafA/YrhL
VGLAYSFFCAVGIPHHQYPASRARTPRQSARAISIFAAPSAFSKRRLFSGGDIRSNAAFHAGFVLAIPAIACACLSYYVVEQPMLRLRERLRDKRTSPEQPAQIQKTRAA